MLRLPALSLLIRAVRLGWARFRRPETVVLPKHFPIQGFCGAKYYAVVWHKLSKKRLGIRFQAAKDVTYWVLAAVMMEVLSQIFPRLRPAIVSVFGNIRCEVRIKVRQLGNKQRD